VVDLVFELRKSAGLQNVLSKPIPFKVDWKLRGLRKGAQGDA
jgi:hypothetical protein